MRCVLILDGICSGGRQVSEALFHSFLGLFNGGCLRNRVGHGTKNYRCSQMVVGGTERRADGEDLNQKQKKNGRFKCSSATKA
ncbi:hypothetical protein SDJN03_07655, partial [Cucurbita argyrosperma subsp. sororia]